MRLVVFGDECQLPACMSAVYHTGLRNRWGGGGRDRGLSQQRHASRRSNASIDEGGVSEGGVQVCYCLLAVTVQQVSRMPAGSSEKDRNATSHGQSSTCGDLDLHGGHTHFVCTCGDPPQYSPRARYKRAVTRATFPPHLLHDTWSPFVPVAIARQRTST